MIACGFEKEKEMAQIKRFGVLQTAKFCAVLYFIMTAIFLIPFGLIAMLTGAFAGGTEGLFGVMFGGMFIFFLPLVYAVMGFIFVAIGCLIYNGTAKVTGGIEIEIE
jgi:hypothetical protein